ncbi:PIR Superfamily Protein [Plasmodium ovale wallikeri]|uniref:Plasmodium vivax Vir protein, putative n=2 Tax=Plasmodium ovale TaxID=36330 RepID=A0A1C3KKJ1_PLAOA|nr:PIR Superfamily Protein [Plasmodium ovale wallikeri]SBT74483.1 Plasmodium vivax Vir protein, putative [Plasmodium ovale]
MDYGELFLKEFNSRILYDELNKEITSGQNSNYCNVMKTTYSEYEGIYDICRMFERNLRNLDNILNKESDTIDRCRYFNFWIHDELRKKLRGDINQKRTDLVREFFKIGSSIKRESLKHNCGYDYNYHITLDLWKEWKDLYDYLKNYDHILNIISTNKYLCRNYKSYYTYITNIYSKYKTDCCIKNNEYCPADFVSSKWCNEDNFLTKLACDETEELQQKRQDSVVSPVDGQEMGREGLIFGSMSLGDGYSGVSNATTMNDFDYNNILSVVFPLLGLTATFFFLYKFTTFGTWLRTNILRKKRINYIREENAQELLEDESYPSGLSYNDNIFNVPYISA